MRIETFNFKDYHNILRDGGVGAVVREMERVLGEPEIEGVAETICRGGTYVSGSYFTSYVRFGAGRFNEEMAQISFNTPDKFEAAGKKFWFLLTHPTLAVIKNIGLAEFVSRRVQMCRTVFKPKGGAEPIVLMFK